MHRSNVITWFKNIHPSHQYSLQRPSNKAMVQQQFLLINYYLKCIDWFRKINPATGLHIYMDCTVWRFSKFLYTSKLRQKNYLQKLLPLVCCKWWLNASFMGRKQLLNYQLMVLLITEFYSSLNLPFLGFSAGTVKSATIIVSISEKAGHSEKYFTKGKCAVTFELK